MREKERIHFSTCSLLSSSSPAFTRFSFPFLFQPKKRYNQLSCEKYKKCTKEMKKKFNVGQIYFVLCVFLLPPFISSCHYEFRIWNVFLSLASSLSLSLSIWMFDMNIWMFDMNINI